MVLIVDTNIILDVLENRKGFETSSIIWELCGTKGVKGVVSSLSMADVIYIMRKELDPIKILDIIRKLNLIFEFADFTALDLIKSGQMLWKDFEDAVQCTTGKDFKADYIITRNIKDFTNSPIEALTPEEFLKKNNNLFLNKNGYH